MIKNLTISSDAGISTTVDIDDLLSILCLAHDAEYSLFDNQESPMLDEIDRLEGHIKDMKRRVKRKKEQDSKAKQPRRIIDRIQKKYNCKRMGPKIVVQLTDRELVQLYRSNGAGSNLHNHVYQELKERNLIEGHKLISNKISDFSNVPV